MKIMFCFWFNNLVIENFFEFGLKMGILDQLSKLGKEISTHLGRKAQKPLNQYKAIEKAHEAIEDHKVHPKRAPMNVPKIEFTRGSFYKINLVKIFLSFITIY